MCVSVCTRSPLFYCAAGIFTSGIKYAHTKLHHVTLVSLMAYQPSQLI